MNAETFLLVFTFIGIPLAVYLNRHDDRRWYVSLVTFLIAGASFALFETEIPAKTQFICCIALNAIGLGAVFAVFDRRHWKDEGYFLIIGGLFLLATWNAAFYVYANSFMPTPDLAFNWYTQLADTLAFLTVTVLLVQSHGVVEWYRTMFTNRPRHLPYV